MSDLMHHLIPYICLLGLFLPVVLLFYNKGFKSANRFLAGFLFFASLYLLESFTFFYVDSKAIVAFFTNTHGLYYLIGPFSYLYVRSTLKDNSSLTKLDGLHFIPFFTFFIGYLPYMVSPWSYKLMIAENILSENWDTQQFHLNAIIPHKFDQLLNVIQIYFYSISLWYLIWKYKRKSGVKVMAEKQYALVKRWLFVFTAFISVITLNFTYAMANMWMYDDKSIFLEKASMALFFASVIYVLMNMTVMFFPHILYGLPFEVKAKDDNIVASFEIEEDIQLVIEPELVLANEDETLTTAVSPHLFSDEYIEKIGVLLQKIICEGLHLRQDFLMPSITEAEGLPVHHLTYYFNNILKTTFSDWRNDLRIQHAKRLIEQNGESEITLGGIAISCGYNSPSTFIRAFKQYTGTTPSDYMKKG
jgi:AraC-like DNA-binding protein